MKNYKYPLYALPVGLFALASCSDFEEVNTNPTAANIEQVREYAINKSITGTQQNPEVAERCFVLNWQTAAPSRPEYKRRSSGWRIQQTTGLAIIIHTMQVGCRLLYLLSTYYEEKMKGELNSHEAQVIPNMKKWPVSGGYI